MPSLSTENRNFIVHLRNSGLGFRSIQKRLRQEGIVVSKSAVRKICQKFDTAGTVANLKIKRSCKFGSDQEHRDYIDQVMNDQPDTTAKTLKDGIFQTFGISVSEQTVAKVRRDLGWIQKGTRYCHMIRNENKEKRLDWCQRMIETGETFEDVIFTDESKIELSDVCRKSYRKKGQPIPRRKRAKHPYSMLVWGGISRRGATPLVMFNGIMDSDWYQKKILRNNFLPFAKVVYPEGHRLYQDNDPKHTSRSTQAFMLAQGVNWWKSPAESPDVNPIENLWKEMKDFCTKKRPKNKDDLKNAILQFWSTVTPEKCNTYINHLYKVMPVVVEKQGDVTGF